MNNKMTCGKIMRKSVKDPRKTSSEIAAVFSEYIGQNISARIVKRRLAKLKECKVK